jgi:hypothetical protein
MKDTNKLEREFQKELIKELKVRFPKCIIAKMDAGYIQGIPDLLILYNHHWALLEVKKDAKAKHRPNQDYYVDICNRMSFAAFIYPENKEDVLHDLEEAFKS